MPPLPAAVEVAAFRIAQEALTNVVRHADARHATVRAELGGTFAVAGGRGGTRIRVSVPLARAPAGDV